MHTQHTTRDTLIYKQLSRLVDILAPIKEFVVCICTSRILHLQTPQLDMKDEATDEATLEDLDIKDVPTT
jgi:hypothetical protein